jgi:hypothetical protein
MHFKRIFLALLVLSISAAGFAADVENQKPAATDAISAPPGAASFFEGTWVGKWGWMAEGDMTIVIEKKGPKGYSPTTYTWEMGRRISGGNTVRGGSLKAYGKETGDRFVFGWKDKDGVKSSITLTKGETENSAKAVYESEGSTQWIRAGEGQAYLKRK